MKALTFLTVLVSMVFISAATHAHAEEGLSLPISSTLLQCGKRKNLKKTCEEDQRCCVFLGEDTVAQIESKNHKEPKPIRVAVLKWRGDGAQPYRYSE